VGRTDADFIDEVRLRDDLKAISKNGKNVQAGIKGQEWRSSRQNQRHSVNTASNLGGNRVLCLEDRRQRMAREKQGLDSEQLGASAKGWSQVDGYESTHRYQSKTRSRKAAGYIAGHVVLPVYLS
jgi:hypothetical protein